MKLFCWIGFHKWSEWDIDFFNPQHIKETCVYCGKKRSRFDLTKRRVIFK